MLKSDPVCYSINSRALGDVIAAAPVLKYAINTYHKDGDYRVIVIKAFRDLLSFIPDSKILDLDDSTWRFDKDYAIRRLNNVGAPKTSRICRLTPAKLSLSHYASIGLLSQVFANDSDIYNYLPLKAVDVSKFGVDFSKAVLLIVTYRNINRSLTKEALLNVAEFIFNTGYTPVYVGRTKDGFWKVEAASTLFTAPNFGVDLVNKTSIFELATIMTKSIATLGVDSGLIHLAGTTSTPIIAGYTNVDWRLRLPARKTGKTFVVEPDAMECLYCSSKWLKDFYNFGKCYYGHINCVRTLTADKYIEKLKLIL